MYHIYVLSLILESYLRTRHGTGNSINLVSWNHIYVMTFVIVPYLFTELGSDIVFMYHTWLILYLCTGLSSGTVFIV